MKEKIVMMDYMTDIKEDAQDFGWLFAKGVHALILFRMEEGKVNWLMSDKLDRFRRAHDQKVMTNPVYSQGTKGKMDSQGMLLC